MGSPAILSLEGAPEESVNIPLAVNELRVAEPGGELRGVFDPRPVTR